MPRERGSRMGGALAVSLALHAVALGVMAFVPGSPITRPKVKVYAVDIVSPPPNRAGEQVAAPLATQEPGEAAPVPAAPEPAPETPPEPVPAPPREAPKEPAKAPAPTRTPERPRETPKQPERPKAEPQRTPPRTEQPKGAGRDADRTTGEGTQRTPATGRNPDASSAGGEGLTIRQSGVRCPSAAYCTNIERQVRRFFRAPESAPSGTGNLCFTIRRDGSVTRIRAENVRGGAAVRIAMMEAAEQAGNRRAFGALPDDFGVDELRVCVDLSPETAR